MRPGLATIMSWVILGLLICGFAGCGDWGGAMAGCP